MYKNFNLTEEEKKQILEQHQNSGYKQPVNEQAPLNASGMVRKGAGGGPGGLGASVSAGLNQAKDRINQVASVMASLKSVQKPVLVIDNPASKLNGMAWDDYVRRFNITPKEINAAKLLKQGGTATAAPKKVAPASATTAAASAAAKPTSTSPAPGTGTGITAPMPGPISELGEGGFWRDVFGEPDIDDSAKSALKAQGHSHIGRDDDERKGEYYMVFNGEKFFPDQIDYADYNDLGDLPRVENGMLIVPNPAWQS